MGRSTSAMIVGYVEPSGESPELARAEVAGASSALGGQLRDPDPRPLIGLLTVEVPSPAALGALTSRLALARRCLREVGPPGRLGPAIASEASDGRSAAFRRIGGSPGGSDPWVRDAGRMYRDGGGTIDLERPDRRYWLATDGSGGESLLLEVATVDRPGSAVRRMPMLPFQRPVSLAPRLARAAANLARVRAGDRVLDPFVGTGALLAEAATLGARAYGIDRDREMVVGTLRNFAHLGVEAAELVEGDAGTVEFGNPGQRFDALLTDPPYGRASGTGGEGASALVERVLPRWADRLVEGGRAVIVSPSGAPGLPPPWLPSVVVPVRVHRSLTREFRVYERRP